MIAHNIIPAADKLRTLQSVQFTQKYVVWIIAPLDRVRWIVFKKITLRGKTLQSSKIKIEHSQALGAPRWDRNYA